MQIIDDLVASFAYDAWIEIGTWWKYKSGSKLVASFAYDAWIEIDTPNSVQINFMSHRLRTMRGLKFSKTDPAHNREQVASFAYDAWIEIDKRVSMAL